MKLFSRKKEPPYRNQNREHRDSFFEESLIDPDCIFASNPDAKSVCNQRSRDHREKLRHVALAHVTKAGGKPDKDRVKQRDTNRNTHTNAKDYKKRHDKNRTARTG